MKQYHIISNLLAVVLLMLIFYISTNYQAVAIPRSGSTYYVATDGDDDNVGSLSQPWRTVQKAADTVEPGSTVYVRDGVYYAQVTINVSGSATDGYITFRNFEGETAILDGTALVVPSANGGMFLIVDQSYIIIQGFEIRNYQTSTPNIVPIAINVRGKAHHIQLRNNHIHKIETNAPVGIGRSGADAHGIAVYGTSAPESINNIIIDGNELHNLKLGSSEALVLNGNVESFTISGNTIHDINNIGIDLIGLENTSPNSAYDQARNGVVRDNTVYRLTSYGNPSYGNEYAAGGIYVDGGRDIVVERNTIYEADIGIEIASEHQGGTTSNITVRNNLVFNNAMTGIAMGGYDTNRGATENCIFVNNTLYNNDTLQEGSGEILLQFEARNNIITNNIIYANSQSLLIGNPFTQITGNVVDYNLYFAPAGSENSEWEWKNETYEGFTAYQTGTGNDSHSLFASPKFIDSAQLDFHLQASSPAIDQGSSTAAPNDDYDGNQRPQGAGYDIGAYEYTESTSPMNIKYYLPYFIEETDYYWTGVALSNSDTTESAHVMVTIYDENGNTIGTVSKVIAPDGQQVFLVSSGSGSRQEGWMLVGSDHPLTGLCFFGTTGLNSYMADITLIDATSTTLHVPHVAQDSTWDTTLLICNPNSSSVTVTLTYVDTTGTADTSKDYTIAAMGSKQIAFSDLISGSSVSNGKVEITATQGVAAFALYNNLKTGGMCYAGISAVEPQ